MKAPSSDDVIRSIHTLINTPKRREISPILTSLINSELRKSSALSARYYHTGHWADFLFINFAHLEKVLTNGQQTHPRDFYLLTREALKLWTKRSPAQLRVPEDFHENIRLILDEVLDNVYTNISKYPLDQWVASWPGILKQLDNALDMLDVDYGILKLEAELNKFAKKHHLPTPLSPYSAFHDLEGTIREQAIAEYKRLRKQYCFTYVYRLQNLFSHLKLIAQKCNESLQGDE
jgi:hypothetical protein